MTNSLSDSIKSSLTMPQVAEFYGYTPNRGHFIRCPFHGTGNERTPSLHIKDRSFRCYSCGASGTVIDFAMLLYGIPFETACVRLNSDFHLGLSTDKPDPQEAARLAEARKRAAEAKARQEWLELTQEEQWWEIFEVWDWLKKNYKTVPDGAMWLGKLDEWLDENNYWWK
jgi:DNA primase